MSQTAMSAKSKISCDFCKASFNPAKHEVCPRCGAPYYMDKEWQAIVEHGDQLDRATERKEIASAELEENRARTELREGNLVQSKSRFFIMMGVAVLIAAVALVMLAVSFMRNFASSVKPNGTIAEETKAPVAQESQTENEGSQTEPNIQDIPEDLQPINGIVRIIRLASSGIGVIFLIFGVLNAIMAYYQEDNQRLMKGITTVVTGFILIVGGIALSNITSNLTDVATSKEAIEATIQGQ